MYSYSCEVICTPLVAEFYVGAIVPVDTLGMLRPPPEMQCLVEGLLGVPFDQLISL